MLPAAARHRHMGTGHKLHNPNAVVRPRLMSSDDSGDGEKGNEEKRNSEWKALERGIGWE